MQWNRGGRGGGASPPPRFEGGGGLECPSALPQVLGGMPLDHPPQCLTFIGINTFDQFRPPPQVKFPSTASAIRFTIYYNIKMTALYLDLCSPVIL